MKKILLFFLIFLIIGCVVAGNNTTPVDNPSIYFNDGDMSQALESGDSNISFNDGYKGYCIEWGEHSAEANESFFIKNTSFAVNVNSGEDVGNYLKTFFVYFYDDAQKDTIQTQHMIWKFTNNKQFSRFNQSLYDRIVAKANTVYVPDSGTLKLNDSWEMVFDFKVFLAQVNEYQNYFAYKIFFREVGNILDNESNTTNNVTHQIINSSVNKTPIKVITQLLNQSSNQVNNSVVLKYDIGNDTYIVSHEKIEVSNHLTGIKFDWMIFCIIIMLIACAVMRTKN